MSNYGHDLGAPSKGAIRPCPAALARFNGLVQRRFLQFSLRGLLGVAALVCLALGGRHLIETYGSSISVETTKAGEPILVRATYCCPFGPRECDLVVGYATADDGASVRRHFGGKRSWLCLYKVECEFNLYQRPRQITLFLRRYEKTLEKGYRAWPVKERAVDVH